MKELNYKEESEKLATVLFPEFKNKIKIRCITGIDSNKIFKTSGELINKDGYALVEGETSFTFTPEDLAIKAVAYDNNKVLFWYPEMFMHPHDQRHIVKTCIEKMIEKFTDKDIDLIFVTDSAIILSDIPDGNVTYIDNFSRYMNMGHGTSLNTFAANLYDIYVNSLMDEHKGVMGDYVAGVINKACDLAKEGNISHEVKETITRNIADDFLARTFNRIEIKDKK